MSTNGSGQSLLDFLRNTPVTLPERSVYISEWGRNVTVRALTAGEKEDADASRLELDKKGRPKFDRDRRYAIVIVSRSIVENGQKILADFRGEQLLAQQPNSVLRKLWLVVSELTGLDDAELEETEKNSEKTTESDSSSDLLSHSDEPSRSSKRHSASES